MTLYSIQFDRAKFKEAVFHICASCDAQNLGAVKLNKVLYLADMIRFAVEGRPITGATYRKRPYGPTTDALLPTLRELQRDGALKIEAGDYFGYQKTNYLPQRESHPTRLTSEELDWLNEAVDFVCHGNTAKTISEFTHNRAWEVVESGAVIPYHNAFYFFPTVPSLETIEWGMRQAAEIEDQATGKQGLEYSTPAAFRERLAKAR